jgi:hypothetical protein
MCKTLLAVAAMMMAQPALAAGPDDLTCMANSYTPQQQAELDALLPQIKIENGGDDPIGAQLSEVVVAAASDCMERLSWSESQLLPAFVFEIGRFMEVAFVRHGPMSADELERIEATLADGDRTDLWDALESDVRAGLSGQASETGTDNDLIYAQFMREAGFGLDATKAEQIAILLGAKAMQRFSQREFGAQN